MMKNRSDKYKTKASSIFFRIVLILLIIITCVYIYARYINTTTLKVNEIKVINDKLNESFDGLKVVQFSDIHYGLTTKENELKKIIDKINFINPDVVVFTGDLIDKNEIVTEEKSNIISSLLAKINSKYGKYAIKGNHDYDMKYFNEIMMDASFTLLEDANDIIYKENGKIFIGGVGSSIKSHIDYEKALSGLDESTYSIMLLHEPDNIDELLKHKNVDLVLAGHSHGGQIRLPFSNTLFTNKGSKKYNEDYYLVNNTPLYISFGIGTTNYPFRTFNPSSINFYRINKR